VSVSEIGSAGRAVFYHLTRSGVDETLVMILTRAREAGWAVMVRGTDRARLVDLDLRLWVATGDEAFMAHGLEGGPHDADQPILLGFGPLPESARGVVLIDGAEASQAEAARLERVWVLFDGGDEGAVARARELWTRLTSGGMAAQYWSEETGRWVLKAEKESAGKQ
jgi:DNA polymerase-3 subunit chi